MIDERQLGKGRPTDARLDGRGLNPKTFLDKAAMLKDLIASGRVKVATEDATSDRKTEDATSDEETAGLLGVGPQHVGVIRSLSKLDGRLVERLRETKLFNVSLGAAIGRYPEDVHKIFVDGLISGKLGRNAFSTYGVIGPAAGKSSSLSVKRRTLRAGLPWPAELDPDGKPIKK